MCYGSEFISKALDRWAYENGVTLDFSRPGKPTDNAFVESFNRRSRDECLNTHWFLSLADARSTIAAFTGLVREKLQNGDTRARKDWLGTLISRVEVDDNAIRIIGSKTMLAATLSGQNTPQGNVRGFVRKWCTRQDSNLRPTV